MFPSAYASTAMCRAMSILGSRYLFDGEKRGNERETEKNGLCACVGLHLFHHDHRIERAQT